MKNSSKAEIAAATPTAAYNHGINAGFIDEEGLEDETITCIGVSDVDCVGVVVIPSEVVPALSVVAWRENSVTNETAGGEVKVGIPDGLDVVGKI